MIMTNDEAATILYKEWQRFLENNLDYAGISDAYTMGINALKQESCEDKGEISDGYHTFNQLYHQRAILFATIVNQNKDKAWKSYKHSDGKYCFDSDGKWFIVGVDTPEGSYTYHYSKEYWDIFDCKELECGKEWDGHTEEDVTRLLSLGQEPCDDCVSRQAVLDCLKATKLKQSKKFDLIIEIRNEVLMLPPVVLNPKSDVLDKIRDEIDELYYIDEGLSFDPQISRDDVLKIIDKYKEESENDK